MTAKKNIGTASKRIGVTHSGRGTSKPPPGGLDACAGNQTQSWSSNLSF